MKSTKKILEKLPDAPGVYFFKNRRGEVLYVGKATSLRDRVRSYFSADISLRRGPLIVKMLADFVRVDATPTDSVLEALILEANLIKKYQPPYNSKEKDNKSFNYVVFTKEKFPKVLVVRGRTIQSVFAPGATKYIFGPFPHGTQLKEAMKIIRRIFPWSDNKCTPAEEQFKKGRLPRPCFNSQIGLCPGVCTGAVTAKEYAQTIKNLKLFFEGRKTAVLRNLKKQMSEFAAKKEFEKAAQVRKTIFALEHIQDVALLKHESGAGESAGGEMSGVLAGENFRIEAYDVAHLSGQNVVGVMTVVEDGEQARGQYRKFKIKIKPGVDDTGALKEILGRRLNHPEWPFPNLIVVDGGQAQINAAHSVLRECGLSIDVVSVVKDERHKPRDIMGEKEVLARNTSEQTKRAILLANSEAHRYALSYHRSLRVI